MILHSLMTVCKAAIACDLLISVLGHNVSFIRLYGDEKWCISQSLRGHNDFVLWSES